MNGFDHTDVPRRNVPPPWRLRKAEIKLGITVSLPPFLKFAFDYKANIGEPANDYTPHRPGRTA